MHIFENQDIVLANAHVASLLSDRHAAVFVLTFGCQQNEADSEKLYGMALQMGYVRANAAEEADLILVNTCAIREHAELKALSIIGGFKKLKKEHPDRILGVVGCMAAEAHRVEELKNRYPYVDFTLEPSSIHLLPVVLSSLFSRRKRRFISEPTVDCAVEGMPIARTLKHRAWVSVMYGCNNFCSYCIVPYVRNRERSRDADEVESEVRALIDAGCHDITLLGQNVNSFHGGCDFSTLLARLDRLDGDFRLRFMTSHPKDARESLIDTMANGKHIAKHLHLPLQSGSDRILKEMNRHYDLNRYMQIVRHVRAVMPDAALTSDIIVGFPGETEEDFSKTLDVLREVSFDSVYAFLYSPRKGTPAAEMDNQVPEEVKHERFSRLLALQDEISLEKNKPYVGKTLRVLVDSAKCTDEKTVCNGRTDTGKLVHFVGNERLIGEFCNVRIDRAEPYTLRGTLIKD